MSAGSGVSQLNLNQTGMYSSRNQCPNQDEQLQRTRCTEKDVGERHREAEVDKKTPPKKTEKSKREKKGGQKDFSSFCHNSFDASRPMKSDD